MLSEENIVIDPVFHRIITTEDQMILRDALLKQCNRILKEIPPNSKHQDWNVYAGTAGLSLLFLNLHEHDPGLMFGSVSALTIANDYIDDALTTYMRDHKLPVEGLPSTLEHECGFLCSAVGLLAVAAHVKHHIGDQESSQRYSNLIQSHYFKEALSPQTPNELSYGRAGYLYTLRYISRLIDSTKEVPQITSSVVESIIEDGIRTAENRQIKDVPLFWIWQDYPYIGAAHGFSGILTILLQFSKQCQEYLGRIKSTIDFILFECRQENGNWSTVLSEVNDNLVQFCHGAPGICFLACKAYEVFKDETYLNLAMELADYTYLHGKIHKGVGLCHGISGNAYPFLSVYKLTKNQKYLQYALEYAKICTQWEERTSRGELVLPDKPWSVFDGLGGSVWFISDLLYWDPEIFKGFPGLIDV